MAEPRNPTKKPAMPQSSSGGSSGRPPPAVKFSRRTSSGRITSFNHEDDIDESGEFSGPNDYMNYTVVMPPTPDNQPTGDTSEAKRAGGQVRSNGPNNYRSTDSKETGIRQGGGNNERDRGGVGGGGKNDRGMSLMRSNNKSILLRSQTADFDHNRWLFETKGRYGIGNAFWSNNGQEEDLDGGVSMGDFMDKPWKPLTRKVNVPPGILSPYRLLIVGRLITLFFFLGWRVTNPNEDAMWLWGMSVVCELWFAFSWVLDILPKFNPINRASDIVALKDKFEQPYEAEGTGRTDLPGVDVFVSTADPEKEPPLVTANTMLSIMACDYPVDKLSCYISDDGGAILTFEAMAEAINFAEVWVPFCRKHNIEPRNPDSYFNLKTDPTKNKKRLDFVKDRRWIKREYDEFKVRINGLPEAIKKRSDSYNSREERKEKQLAKEKNGGTLPEEPIDVTKATWMADGTHWPGTWFNSAPDHSKGDHAGILQVMSKVPDSEPVMGHADEKTLDFTGIDVRLPMFAYVSREKRPGYDHNKKAGAMNAMVRASAILSNGPFILNLDCDHYVYNCQAIREGMCFMMDRGGDRVCYIQFPQRFEGIDPSDRYANHNTVFFDGNMRALDGLQGPVYVGTGCMFRRYALYGFCPPRANDYTGMFGLQKTPSKILHPQPGDDVESEQKPLTEHPDHDLPRKFGNSNPFVESIAVAEFQGRPLADHISVKNGRPPGALLAPRPPLDAPTVAEAVAVISCWFEDDTEWGDRIGWIYGSVTEDVVTGYRMHNRGWRSVYCITKRDAFRGSAPINLTDRLHQVLRWATGSVEIFFSKNNALLGTSRLKFLQRVAYLNVGIYPFTSIFLVVYCFLPAFSLFSGQFIVQGLNVAFLVYLLIITVTLTLTSLLEVKWSGIALEEWWRNEQFWVIGGTSAHLAAVIQGLLKVIAGIEISFTLTTKSSAEDEEDIYADLYVVKWTSLFIMPLSIIIVNISAVVIGFSRTIYSVIPQWSKLFGGLFFSFWVLAHMYPFIKGLLGRRGRVPTIVKSLRPESLLRAHSPPLVSPQPFPLAAAATPLPEGGRDLRLVMEAAQFVCCGIDPLRRKMPPARSPPSDRFLHRRRSSRILAVSTDPRPPSKVKNGSPASPQVRPVNGASTRIGDVSQEIKRVRAQMEENEQLAILMQGLRGQNLRDTQFADDNVQLRLVEVDESSEFLPLVYDPTSISAYWGKRPRAVATRIVQLLSVAGGFLSQLALDVLNKKVKENEVARAIELREIVTSLGPAYIKLGQALSIRPDILSPVAMTELQKLCDKVPSFPDDVAMALIKEELGQPWQEIYSELSPSPIAAASLGQVYKGRLKENGDLVAVKVQRPFVLETVTVDLFIIRNLGLVLRKFPQISVDVVGLVDEWAARFFEELDYVNEGENGDLFAEMMKKDLPQVVVPRTYHKYTSRKVLTTEWIEGEKLSQSTESDVGELVNVGVICYLKQLLDTGFFHADPHPGNLIRTPDGKLAILDFGLVTRLTDDQKYGMIEAIAHLIHRDYDAIVKDFVKLDFIPEGVNLKPILPVLAKVFDQALEGGGAKNINFQELASDLAQITFDYPFRIPPYFALIIRAIGVLEGIALVGNPDFAIVDEAYPYIAQRLLTDESPRLRNALRYTIYGKSGVFDADRFIDVMQAFENFITAAKSGGGEDLNGDMAELGIIKSQPNYAIPLLPMATSQPSQQVQTRAALSFLLSDQGNFFREFLLDEIVKGIDAVTREQLVQFMALLGVRNASPVFSMVPRFGPIKPAALLPTITEEDRIILNNVQKVVEFLTAGSSISRASDQGLNVSQIVQELLPVLPGISAKVLPEVVSRLTSRVLARLIRDSFLFS
ncbi:hypothetical protein SAY86_015475 [Trapa natans]|uniref:Protein kinase domain-containing protein n=1 Tax=Trapa natans TaxID=22666 RepID=A0AAN7LE77_TRANT|nr:hypothetical protein SAY86_015475 [Trapa natans]